MKMNERQKAIRQCITKTVSEEVPQIVEFTKKLIEIPTENPPGRKYKECVEQIRRKLQAFEIDTEVVKIPNEKSYPRYALLASLGDGEPTVYFHGHYDVVPADEKTQFSPSVKNGRLFGRGSTDMKGGLAAMVFASKALRECDVSLHGTLSLVIVPDEETGGKYGTKYLYEHGFLENGIAVLMPEPTSGNIWHAWRGAISLLLTINGKKAHCLRHYEGRNPFKQLVQVANELLELKAQVETRQTGFDISPEKAKNSILALGGICKSRGGTNFHTFPEKCSFSIDRRINPEEDFSAEKKAIFDY